MVRFVEYLAKALRDYGHTPIIIAPRIPSLFYKGDERHEPGIGQIRVPVLPVPIKEYFATFPSPRMLVALKSCDLIIINSLSWTSIYAMGINKLFKKPVYQFVHHDEFELARLVFKFSKPVVDFFMGLVTHLTLSMDRYAIATNKFYEKTLRFHGDPKKIFRVPFVYEKQDVDEKLIEEFRQTVGIPKGNKVLLYLGRLANEKNTPVVFEVLKHFSEIPGISCLMVGRGYHLQPLRDRVKKEKLKVILTGRLHDKFLPAVYTLADMLVTPTFHETLCFTVVEALNYHTVPVVNGRYHEPSLTEENTIFIKDITDKDEIIDKISNVLFNEEKLAQMQKNTETAAAYHSYESFAKIWAEEVAKVKQKE